MASGAIISSIVSSDSSRKAANAQADAAKNATEVQWGMYKQNREDYAPWRMAGENAVENLSRKVAAGPGDFYKSPGYDFRLAEGNKALERSAASRTGALGADTERALIRYNQDYASGEYQNFLNQYYQSLTPYQSLAGLGMTATTGVTNAGTNAANQIAQSQMALGNAQAAGTINQANAITGSIQSGFNNAISGYNAWRQSQQPSYVPVNTNVDSMGNAYGTTYDV